MSEIIEIPADIITHLDRLETECPGCHGNLRAEPDARMRTGFAWTCENVDCTELGGCWCVTEGEIRRAKQHSNR